MRRQFIGGNWKMNGLKAELSELLTGIVEQTKALETIDMAVFPSHVYLETMAQLVQNSPISLGGQNHCDHESGAYTGEISPLMLQDVGCQYVLLGHSERRHLFGETNPIIARKFALAQRHQLTPILCVGETEVQRDLGEAEFIVREQINAVIHEAGVKALNHAMISYEPVWAIGTGKTATPEEAQTMHTMIRLQVAQYDPTVADQLRIIYGGSLKPANAKEILAQSDIDGGLIGGASLKIADFVELCQIATEQNH